jgi:signal transduction histidine kinase
MPQIETDVLRRVSAKCLIGTLAVALLTLVGYQLHLNLSTVGFLYLIVVVLLSGTGDFLSSAFVSILAVGCLDYFFAQPVFSFRVVDPLNVVAIAAFLTTSLVITRQVSRLREMTNEALSSIHRKLIDAEERERTRIARELHDDINQRISLVALDLAELEEQTLSESDAEVGRQIQKILQRVSTIGADLHSISHGLHYSSLDILGIAASTENYCGEFAKRQKVKIDFKSHDVPSPLPLEISLHLFRVLQEALLNSVKHSGERYIEVELFGTSDAMHLTVCDSGFGFDPKVAMQGSGLGLVSMRERLKLLNGKFSIDSKAGHGSKIHASVPFSSESYARELIEEIGN